MDFGFQDIPFISESIPENERENSGRKGESSDDAAEKSEIVTDVAVQQISDIINEIGKKVEDLIERIHDSRSRSQTAMDDFQQELLNKVTRVCEEMRGNMYTVYEDNGNEMQMKLAELSKVLDNCTRLHRELLEATQALSGLRASLSIKMQE